MAEYNALQVPPSARENGGVEVLRAAVIGGGLHVTLRRAFDDPQAWGVLLADVARQVARVYQQQGDLREDEVVAAIRESFEKEISAPDNAGTIAPIA
ncbi:MAG: DUF5076 domain-containing protein [Pseudorhodoplanes sp.]